MVLLPLPVLPVAAVVVCDPLEQIAVAEREVAVVVEVAVDVEVDVAAAAVAAAAAAVPLLPAVALLRKWPLLL